MQIDLIDVKNALDAARERDDPMSADLLEDVMNNLLETYPVQ